MDSRVTSFIEDWQGKYSSYGSTAKNQCFSVAQLYASFWGYPLFTGNAINIIGEDPGSDWEVISPQNIEPGDLIVFGDNAAIGTGAYGHVAIAVSKDGAGWKTFGQNAPAGSPCGYCDFGSLEGILGALRPKALVAVSTPTPSHGTAEAVREAAVRVAPTTTAALGGSKELAPGSQFVYTSVVTGQSVTENGVTTNQWYLSSQGHYVWAGNVKSL